MIKRAHLESIRALVRKHQVLTALMLVIIVTGIMTSISMSLYIQSGASGLDLSRPGFNNVRNDLQQDATAQFKSTGTMTLQDVAAFKKLYQKQRDALNSLSAFDDDALSDAELGLTLPTPEATATQ